MSARPGGAYRFLKRGLDFAGAFLLLTLLSPLMLLIWGLVRLRMGSPALFRQERPGLGARPFFVLKFRSMTEARDAEGALLPNQARVTPLGRFLRRTSLDELPQLWNVLKGDMSFVGPRPLLMEYVPRYSPEQRRRMDVRPGITGLAQVRGRNFVEWEDRFRLDVEYVDHLSLGLDLKILFLTAKILLLSRSVDRSGVDPVTKFMGSSAPVPDRDSAPPS